MMQRYVLAIRRLRRSEWEVISFAPGDPNGRPGEPIALPRRDALEMLELAKASCYAARLREWT